MLVDRGLLLVPKLLIGRLTLGSDGVGVKTGPKKALVLGKDPAATSTRAVADANDRNEDTAIFLLLILDRSVKNSSCFTSSQTS